MPSQLGWRSALTPTRWNVPLLVVNNPGGATRLEGSACR
jgi:hypothetical protein